MCFPRPCSTRPFLHISRLKKAPAFSPFLIVAITAFLVVAQPKATAQITATLSGTWEIETDASTEKKLASRNTQIEIFDEKLNPEDFAKRLFPQWADRVEHIRRRLREVAVGSHAPMIARVLTVSGFEGCNYFTRKFILTSDDRLEDLGLELNTQMACQKVVPAPATEALNSARKIRIESDALELIGYDGSVVGRFVLKVK